MENYTDTEKFSFLLFFHKLEFTSLSSLVGWQIHSLGLTKKFILVLPEWTFRPTQYNLPTWFVPLTLVFWNITIWLSSKSIQAQAKRAVRHVIIVSVYTWNCLFVVNRWWYPTSDLGQDCQGHNLIKLCWFHILK